MMSCPVLLLIFNRPDLTKRVFERIREVQPSQLFIAADGPRLDHPGEVAICTNTRAVVEQVDWECETHTLFRDHNLGCKRAVSSAIDWFFEQVEEGIILEDDCLPHHSFFRFCEELLQRYRSDERLMSVTGDNFLSGYRRTEHSYYYSRYPLCWGWATWRRAWRYYDPEMAIWPRVTSEEWLGDILLDRRAVDSWSRIFEATFRGEIDSWAYGWTFACWVQSGLTIVPGTNLVSNIGFGADGTHTTASNDTLANIPAREMCFPINHPPFVIQDTKTDRQYQRDFVDRPTIPERVLRRIRAKLRKG